MNDLEFLENCNKEEFINYSKNFNVYKTMKNPDYLIIKTKILDLLSKFDLTVDDILPDPRILDENVQTCKSNLRINRI